MIYYIFINHLFYYCERLNIKWRISINTTYKLIFTNNGYFWKWNRVHIIWKLYWRKDEIAYEILQQWQWVTSLFEYEYWKKCIWCILSLNICLMGVFWFFGLFFALGKIVCFTSILQTKCDQNIKTISSLLLSLLGRSTVTYFNYVLSSLEQPREKKPNQNKIYIII